MKFQAAAMARANIPEEERKDFALYVDEFQNFATDSFQTILSEARKYRLSLVLGNQFMTQLKEDLREAIIGNVGTTVTGRIGITDAEIMVKRYMPVFDAEDLTKLPNYESVVVAQIQGVPSAPFSMNWIPPMGQANQQLSDALKRLSAAKYGRPRGQVEQDIFRRLSVQKEVAKAKPGSPAGKLSSSGGAGSSFLDEWLAKRQQLTQSPGSPVAPTASRQPSTTMQPPRPATAVQAAPMSPQPPKEPVSHIAPTTPTELSTPIVQPVAPVMSISEKMAEELDTLSDKSVSDESFSIRGKYSDNDEVSIKLH